MTTQLQLINNIIIIIIIIISFMQAIYTYIPETNYHSYQPLHRSTELYHYYYCYYYYYYRRHHHYHHHHLLYAGYLHSYS